METNSRLPGMFYLSINGNLIKESNRREKDQSKDPNLLFILIINQELRSRPFWVTLKKTFREARNIARNFSQYFSDAFAVVACFGLGYQQHRHPPDFDKEPLQFDINIWPGLSHIPVLYDWNRPCRPLLLHPPPPHQLNSCHNQLTKPPWKKIKFFFSLLLFNSHLNFRESAPSDPSLFPLYTRLFQK